MARRSNPTVEKHPQYNGPFGLKYFGAMNDQIYGDSKYHHNLARGTCYCQNSNFGIPYREEAYYHGSKGGMPFRKDKVEGCKICGATEKSLGDLLSRCGTCRSS